MLAGAWIWGDGVCREELDLDADVVGADADGGVPFGGGQPGGAYAGLVHGIASRPKSKPKVTATPATGGPPHPHPPNPRDAFAKAVRAISLALDRQGTVC